MSDERKIEQKQVKTNMLNNEALPTLYVNSVTIRSGFDDFFLTFGIAQPLEITDSKELDKINSVDATPVFRCAVSRTMMKQMIDVMTSVYGIQTDQVELLQSYRKEVDDNDSSSDTSKY